MDSLNHPNTPGQIRGRRRWPFWVALLCAVIGNNAGSVAGFEGAAGKPVSQPVEPVKPAPEDEGDVLVLKNLEVTRGKLVSASSSGVLRWKPAVGKEFEMQPENIAGIRLAATRRPEQKPQESMIELRNGDLLYGEITTFNLKQIVLKHPQLGAVTVERSRLLHLYPNEPHGVIHGGIEATLPLKIAPDTRPIAFGGADGKPIKWVYLDGTYNQKPQTSGLQIKGLNALHWEVPAALEQFEVRFDVAMSANGQPAFIFMLRGDFSDAAVQISLSYPNVQIMQMTANLKRNQRRTWKAVSLQNKVPIIDSRMNIRILVNETLGTIQLFMNGVLAFKVGEQLGERMPGLGHQMLLGAYPNSATPISFSNVWIGSWNGELPKAESAPSTTFSNDDVTAGTVSGFADGKFSIESEIGMLQVPRENVKVIDFGGALAPEQAKGKIRLSDGSAVSVESFKWNDGALSAHSALLGDLRLPAEAVAELVYNPAPSQSLPAPVLKMPRPARGRRGEVTF